MVNCLLLSVLGLIGSLLILIGWRGRRMNDHPVCRRCRFDLVGIYPPATGGGGAVCPECGSRLDSGRRVLVGARRRQPIVLAVGAGTLLVAGTLGGMWFAVVEIRHHMPAWMLRLELDYGEMDRRAAALRELMRRMQEGELTGEAGEQAVTPFIRRALERQADESRPWGFLWGDFVEVARGCDLLDDADWERYLSQALRLTLRPRSPVGVGDPIVFMIDEEFRLGRRASLDLWMQCTVPVLEHAVETGGRPIPPQNTSQEEPAPIRLPWLQNIHRAVGAMPPGRSFWHPPVPAGAGRGFDLDAQQWPLAAAEGEYIVRVAIEARLYEGPSGLNSGGPARGEVIRQVFQLAAPVEIVSKGAITVRQRRNAQLDALVARSLWLDGVSVRGQTFSFTFRASRLPIGIAAEAFLRHGEREWPLGDLVTGADVGRSGALLALSGRVDSLTPEELEHATVILRPSENAALRSAHLWEFYGGEIVFQGLRPNTFPTIAP